jgi:AcrR family transcriptional regulator
MDGLTKRTTETRTRLLKAAAEVFATAGITGATTREIARAAGVNEVTLFRHFQSKEQLLRAVVQQVMGLQMEILNRQDEWSQDLHRDLMHYAVLYSEILEKHEALIRTFIGEAQRRPEAAQQVIHAASQERQEKLIAYLRSHQEKGAVRTDLDLRATVDSFIGMLLSGMLRRTSSPTLPGYSSDRYIKTCVEIFVRGISP